MPAAELSHMAFIFSQIITIIFLKSRGNWLCGNNRRMSTGGPCQQPEGEHADSCLVPELLAEAVNVTSTHCMELRME